MLLSTWGKKKTHNFHQVTQGDILKRLKTTSVNDGFSGHLLQVFNDEVSWTIIRILEKQGATGPLEIFLDQCFPEWVPWKMD